MTSGNEQFNIEQGLIDLGNDIALRSAAADALQTAGASSSEQAAAHLANLRAIGAAARELAVSGGVEAVERGIVTQAEAADLLHVHPITIGRWMQRRRAGEPLNNRTTPRERR